MINMSAETKVWLAIGAVMYIIIGMIVGWYETTLNSDIRANFAEFSAVDWAALCSKNYDCNGATVPFVQAKNEIFGQTIKKRHPFLIGDYQLWLSWNGDEMDPQQRSSLLMETLWPLMLIAHVVIAIG